MPANSAVVVCEDADAHPFAQMPPATTLKNLPTAALTGLVCDCAARGDIEGIRSLIEARADPNMGTAYDMRTPLHLAAAAGNLKLARFLIEDCGATLRRDRFGLLPIHDAVQNGHNDVRRYLQSWKLSATECFIRKHVASNKTPVDSKSVENLVIMGDQMEPLPEVMSAVFELVVKEGIFSYSTVQAEVEHFFNSLGFHCMYYQHFTSMQIAKHIQCLIAAKHVAHATNHLRSLEFDLCTEHNAFFLTTLGSDPNVPTESQLKTEEKIAEHLGLDFTQSISLTFMASEGPAFRGEKERLGIYSLERGHFEKSRVSDQETCLNVLASSAFLKGKTKEAKEQYQIVMEDVVASRRSMVNIIPGEAYPGNFSGFVVLFATAETAGRNYFKEVWQSMRFLSLCPRRFYYTTFANGVVTYSLFFPAGVEKQVERLKRSLLYSTLLKATPNNSALIYDSVMQSHISHECGLYLLAAVKFVYDFFPKEQYAPEYISVHKVLEHDPASQRKLETLYKLCIKDLLCTERIYQLVQRYSDLARMFFEDFSKIALGEVEPRFNAEISKAIDRSCADPQDRQILKMFLTFNHSILLTNFFKEPTPGALSFRLNPAIALKDRPTSLYPEIPHGIYLICGRDFMGFHTRFRDVSRGGIRLVLSRDKTTYERNFATLFEECYNLAFTQQYKNKDIPEGGSKGVILPDRSWPNSNGGNVVAGASIQGPLGMRSCFTRYLDALLDCMMPEQSGIYAGHLKGRPEILFFGPDENTAGFMDLGAEHARVRGYPYWKSLTTGKSVALGGVPHDTYGMTTQSVHTYVTELLKELGEEEDKITKFQTGGPDGDLGSNEILISKDLTIGIVDGSGVLYDPSGLSRAELTRLAQRRVPVREFNRCFLGNGGFLVTVEETNITLPDGSTWLSGAELRDNFHLTEYASADLFVPCGGRPNSVTTDNVKRLFTSDGKPKFRMVVEGANLFFSDRARGILEAAGVHIFKDASTNKGGVNSSSLEVLAALALTEEDHSSMMCFDPACGGVPPTFYETYVRQIQDTIVENARNEFRAIWTCNQRGISKVQATKLISSKINGLQDAIMEQFIRMCSSERERLVRQVLELAVPPVMLQHLTVECILQRIPSNYMAAVVGAWVASRFVYSQGVDAAEVSFFFFLRNLLSKAPAQSIAK